MRKIQFGPNLKKTQLFRVSSDGIALNKPHQAVFAQKISNCIVQTIRMTYDDKNLKVKAHSTRTICPSWAFYKGASIQSKYFRRSRLEQRVYIYTVLFRKDAGVLKQ